MSLFKWVKYAVENVNKLFVVKEFFFGFSKPCVIFQNTDVPSFETISLTKSENLDSSTHSTEKPNSNSQSKTDTTANVAKGMHLLLIYERRKY